MPNPARRRRQTVILTLSYLFLIVLALEIGARLAWKLDRKVPFLTPARIIDGFYKQLPPIKAQPISPNDNTFDILLLGGSVISKFYTVERLLTEQLNYPPFWQSVSRGAGSSHRATRIHNAAHPAHTSLDSLYKYRELVDQPFDLVIIYHGINETRTNNCPSAVFQADYSHYAWYQFIQSIERHPELPYTILPYTLHFLWINLRAALGTPHFIPFRQTQQEWLHHGKDIKTAGPFRNNLTYMIEIARQKKEAVFLMTFAYYIAPGYTQDKFLQQELDYTLHKRDTPIETWGLPDNVRAGIDTHNTIVRELAGQYDHVTLVDQHQLIPATGNHYLDICHFTVEGARKWVQQVVHALHQSLQTESATSTHELPCSINALAQPCP